MVTRHSVTFATGSLRAACLALLGIATVQADDAKDGVRVKFVAYNLHNYMLQPNPEPRSSPPKPEREISRMVRILTELKPDLLGLEEIGTQEDLADLQSRLKVAGIDLPEKEWVQGPDPVRHVALLSRFPIAARNSRPNLTYTLDDAHLPMQRGILDVTVQLEATEQLRLVGLHLKSQREVEDANQALMRREEAHLARLHVEQILSTAPATNLLVFGDLNESRDNPGVRELKGPVGQPMSLRELSLEDQNGTRWTYYHEPSDSYSHIDYVLASAGLVPELRLKQSGIYGGKDWSEASDHRPIFLTLVPVEQRP